MKRFKILGKHGRITIPFEIRQQIGFQYNDILSFTLQGETVVVKREKLCDDCKERPVDLYRYLDSLSKPEQWKALAYLTSKAREKE